MSVKIKFATRLLQLRFKKTGQKFRDVHAKSNGCAFGEFHILPGLPLELAQGLFATAANYRAAVRFSNSAPWFQADIVPDARGLAIQVEDVPGEKLATQTTTQDFILVNHPCFIVGTVKELLQIEVRQMGRRSIQSLPLFGLALIILNITLIASIYTGRVFNYVTEKSMPSPLLRQVMTRVVMIPVWIIGIYFVLRISGLTQMALTVLGGTGLAGLIIGIAFQNIAENFLASILTSVQRPFQPNDFVDVAGYQGLIQRVTARGTILITPEGNHVQIPNALIYRSVIRNFTANPNSRLDFSIAVGLGNSACHAQELALKVLKDHPAVLKSPEPMVLVEELAPSMVKLRAYAWINVRENDGLKTKSALMRLNKRAYDEKAIGLADPEPEVVFPRGLSTLKLDGNSKRDHESSAHRTAKVERQKMLASETDQVSHPAEGNLQNDEEIMKQQAAQSRELESGPDLLESNGRH